MIGRQKEAVWELEQIAKKIHTITDKSYVLIEPHITSNTT